ncbi:unnamed protein product [Brachionus calyciflorus]|uniref:Uncharacterized protein n=1 Tax=Brachionus calyciflorus TaxID=104777 RepID=A0A813XUQ6_9BILA|nr:unnamed protein product [Brachionus calyciflorus]
MNSQLKSKVVIVSHEKKRLLDQYNQKIEFLKNFLNSIESISQIEHNEETQNLLTKCSKDLNYLLENEYFHLNYISNPLIKHFTLRIIETYIKYELNYQKRLEIFKIIENLMEWEVNLSEVSYCSNSQYDYEDFFIRLIPHIKSILFEKNKTDINNNNLLALNTSENVISLMIYTCNPQSIIPFIKTITYMFLCVRYSSLIKYEFIQEALEFLLNNMLISPLLSSELALAIAVNICNFKREKDLELERVISEETKLIIHDQCSSRTIYLMELNVRNDSCRDLLKKALNIYCEYINPHVDELSLTHEMLSVDSENGYEDSIVFKWRQLLYKIVISIVKILRGDFEDENHVVDIELVIYFYELLKANLESLTYEDSLSIAQKLMDIIVKISDWSRRSKKHFHNHQFYHLKSLSFELTIKFITILKHDFCKTHWLTFQDLWIKSIYDWDMLSFKAISAFCHSNIDIEYFSYKKILAKGINDAWNLNSNQKCKCKKLKDKDPKEFMNSEIINSIVDLTLAYDSAICSDKNYLNDFLEEIMPLLSIYLNLFKAIDTKKRLIMFNIFYTKLFKVTSTALKNFSLWKNHFFNVVYILNKMCENGFEFEYDDEVYQTTLENIKSLVSLVGIEEEVQIYRPFFESVLIFIYNNSNLIQMNKMYQDIFSLYYKK